MSDLSSAVQGLFEFLSKQNMVPPAQDVRIVEISEAAPLDARGRFRIRRDALRELGEYEARFEELIQSHLPWVNVSCYGVDNGKVIVAIELPGSSSKPSPRTSVNYSGPPTTVIEHDWSVEPVLVLE
jgi:hypothetical protein